jgi:hypothetical protein
LLERKYGKKVKDLYLVRLHPNHPNKTYELIPVPSLDKEIQQLLNKIAGTLGVNVDTTDIQALLDEITSLRQQLVDVQTTVNNANQLSNQA